MTAQGPIRSHGSRDPLQRAATEPPRALRIATRAGTTIHALVYEPEGPIVGNVLIHSATACPQRFYTSFARHLSQSGLRVFTYDYRGIGDSRPRSLRAESVTMADWAQLDARAMHEHIESHYPGVPLAIVGHSFGAQLVGILDEVRTARAALFVGGQFGYFGHWPRAEALGLRALWKVLVPTFCRVFGYLPKQAGLGEDLPRGVALQWARWCSHPEYLISDFPDARARFARFARPVLAYSFSDDTFAPAGAVDALHAQLTAARITARRLSPAELGLPAVGHFGFFRPRAGAKLWDEACDYLREAMQPDPQLSASA